jgi:hypothetical protein
MRQEEVGAKVRTSPKVTLKDSAIYERLQSKTEHNQ